MNDQVRWWMIRRAQNRSSSLYLCPFCDGRLSAMSEHMLIAPEGDTEQRRHAHTGCVAEARRDGRLPTRDEWQARQPRPPSRWHRLHTRLRRR